MMELWNAEQYNNSNGIQRWDAELIIQRILKDDIQECEIIMDVGCGTGNVTEMLSESIPHKKLYGFECDKNMVKFCQTNFKNDNMEYFFDDISVEWDNLSPTLKQLEGKVCLVWSNCVLQWLVERDIAATNIARLLKPGGRCFLNFEYLGNPNKFLPPKEREQAEKVIKYPSQEEYAEAWNISLSKSGLSSFNTLQTPKDWKFIYLWNMIFERSTELMMIFVNKSIGKEEQQECIDKYKDLFLRASVTPPGQPILEKLPANPMYQYVQFLTTGTK